MRSCDKLHLCDHLELNEGAYFYKKEAVEIGKDKIQKVFESVITEIEYELFTKVIRKKEIVHIPNTQDIYYSLLIFRFTTYPSFLDFEKEDFPSKLTENRLAYLLIVEINDYVILVKKNISHINSFINSLTPIPSDTLAGVLVDNDTVFQQMKLSNMNMNENAMRNKSYEANSLENTMPMFGSNHTIVNTARFTNTDGLCAVNINTSRLAKFGAKKNLLGLLEWMNVLITKLDSYVPQDSFFSRFAKPQLWKKQRDLLEPVSLLIDIFKGNDLTKVNSHTINYGKIVDKSGNIIDEVLVSVMLAPRTFTAEDTVEINTHGGIAPTNKVLELLLTSGCRLAEPGEFTKRAFLNGRIDLVKSEAVMDLIESKSDEARKVALSQLGGKTSNLITTFRNTLKQLLSSIEVNIDYPEYYDIEVMTIEKIKEQVSKMKVELEKLVKESENTTIIRDGIKTVIIGKPNVGKSSILNKLLEKDKAIVTDIAGTTRDIVEGEIYLDGILLNIIDTAGIRTTDDVVEKIGVEKSLSMIDEADLVIVVLNSNEEISEEDKEILEKTKDKTRIIVLNKNDLERKLVIPTELKNVVETNTNDLDGITSLKKKIKELFNLEQIATKDYTYLTNSRQISLAKQAYKNLLDAEQAINEEQPVDMIEIDLKDCFDTLGEIIGATYSEEIIDNLFENFCVGK